MTSSTAGPVARVDCGGGIVGAPFHFLLNASETGGEKKKNGHDTHYFSPIAFKPNSIVEYIYIYIRM